MIAAHTSLHHHKFAMSVRRVSPQAELTAVFRRLAAWNGHTVVIYPTELGAILGCDRFESRLKMLAAKWRATDPRGFRLAMVGRIAGTGGTGGTAIAGRPRCAGVHNEAAVLRLLAANSTAGVTEVTSTSRPMWWRTRLLDGVAEGGLGCYQQQQQQQTPTEDPIEPGPYVISGEVDAVVRTKDCPIDVPVEIKTRGSAMSLGVYPRERLQLQAYIQAMDAPWGLHVQNVLGTTTVVETRVPRDDEEWNTRVVPAVEAFVCDVRRVVRNCAADAELIRAVLEEASAGGVTVPSNATPPPQPPQLLSSTSTSSTHNNRLRYRRRSSVSVPCTRTEVASAVAATPETPAIPAPPAPYTITLLHDLRILVKPSPDYVFVDKQRVQLARVGNSSVRVVLPGGKTIGAMHKTVATHLSQLVQVGSRYQGFKTDGTVISCPSAARPQLVVSITVRGPPRMLHEVGRFVSTLLKFAPVLPKTGAAAAPAAQPAEAAPPLAPLTMCVATQTETCEAKPAAKPAVKTAAKPAAKRCRGVLVSDPVLRELVKRYGTLRVAGIAMCTRSHHTRVCKQRRLT
jgi:hypothetical protein